MTNYLILYHALVVLAIMLSFVAYYLGHKRYFPLLLVLILTEAVEMIAQIATTTGAPFVVFYHVFVVIEFTLLSLYLKLAINIKKVSTIITCLIPVFILYSLSVSHYFYQFDGFPGINISSEGFLLFIFCMILLFNLKVLEHQSIFANPDVWIALGLMIFEGGTFFYNGVYTKLFSIDPASAIKLFGLINKPLNICLYTFINIGLICLIKKKKFTIQ